MHSKLQMLRNLLMRLFLMDRWRQHGADGRFVWRRWNDGRWEFKEMSADEAKEALNWWATK